MPTSTPYGPRLCWLTTEFFPPEMGGTGIITARLAEGLAQRALDIQVITRQSLPPCAPREAIGRVLVHRIAPSGRAKGAGWRALPTMLAFLARVVALLIGTRSRYDLVIISGMKIIPLAAVPVCRLLGKKCVIRIESPFELIEPISAESLAVMSHFAGRLLNRCVMTAQRLVLRRADRVIAISADIAKRLQLLGYPQARIVRIPNAVDLARFKPVSRDERRALRARLGLPTHRTILLYAGRLSRSKGVMMLMGVLPELVAAHPELFVVIVGSGRGAWDDCESEVIAGVRGTQLAAHVALAGQSERVEEYLQAADLFVSPSDYEGFGLTIVEALACATPTVATAVGIAPEIIDQAANGFLCPPKNPQAFREAVSLALAQQERWPQIGRLAREAAARFDMPLVIDQYVRLCLELYG
jgi:glycosyltransferase involved in cell wall biosynthesis